ncbi:uncharacterized protein LOC135199329 [Macrobrachium nipponense]|uniref:uncharacterized protein LOC135199329 n=1 Tax=Macrobrachium nipponense TaxID=159736 RepID=UPI0030C81710
MVAKMPKVNSTMKKMPHMRTMTKTTLKKKKIKVVGGPKETSLKVVKKKKMKNLKKKAITDGTVVKSVKAKLKGKKLKGKKKKPNIKTGLSSAILNEDLMSSCPAAKEGSSADSLKTSGDKKRENTSEVKPAESEASKVEISVPAEKCVVHQLPDFSMENLTKLKTNNENLKKLKKSNGKDCKINPEKKKKKGKKIIRKKKLISAKGLSVLQGAHTGDGEVNSGSNVQEHIPLKADKLGESTAVKNVETKKKKKIQGSKIKAQGNKKNGLKKTGQAGIKKKTKKNLKERAKGTNMDSEEHQNNQEPCESPADAEDGHEEGTSTSQKTAEQTFEELPPLSFIIDTEKDKKGNSDGSKQKVLLSIPPLMLCTLIN